MKQRLASPSDVIDLGKIKELVGIKVSGETLTIRRRPRYYDVAQSAEVKKAIPALAHLASRDRRSGRCAIAAPSAARSPTTIRRRIIRRRVLALGATIKTNKRPITADEFFKGLFETALEDGEIITAVAFPMPAKAGYEKFRHPGLALCDDRRVRGQDQGGDVRVAVTGASQNGVFRVPAIEAALKANWSAAALEASRCPPTAC